MNTINLNVKANRDVIEDTNVSVKVDTTTSMWRNEVTLWFDNGDYCDINVRTFRQTGRYLTTYLNVYACDAFIEGLKTGKILIQQVFLSKQALYEYEIAQEEERHQIRMKNINKRFNENNAD